MKGMTLKNITEACKGVYYGSNIRWNEEVSDITTDSRKVTSGCLFVAISGKNADGNDYIASCYQNGAICCISEKEPAKEYTSFSYIRVSSVFQALMDMAKFYRTQMTLPVIGVTGSTGKTSTKEMIASVLSRHYCTLKTKGNYNNALGVPLTILSLRDAHEIAVVEMGISDFGEMTLLSDIVRPDVCVITNIGQCHLENLKDLDGVLRAKTEIFTHMNPKGRIYLNGDDPKLIHLSVPGEHLVQFYGTKNKNDVTATDILILGTDGTRANFLMPDCTFKVNIPAPGRHMVSNALAAAAIAADFGLTPEEITQGIADFVPLEGHNCVEKLEKFTLLNDCYNANPTSVRAELEVLSASKGRKVAILGDMLELGQMQEKLHEDLGEQIGHMGIDVLICIGTLARHIALGAKKSAEGKMQIYTFALTGQAEENLPHILLEHDAVLVKASHGMHFESIAQKIKAM